ncbi:uncharacterized protein LOC144437499 [Glandiceps talaboti]
MEYYVYLIIVLCVVVKLGIYLCWYQSRKQRLSENATQVRVVMPDGSVRVMTVRGNLARRSVGLPQHVVTGDTIYQYDNPVITLDGCVTRPPPTTGNQQENTEVTGQLPSPPSYPGQMETKQGSTDLPPAYSAIFTQEANENNFPTTVPDPASPAILPIEPDAGITIGLDVSGQIMMPSPPPYSATDTSVQITDAAENSQTVPNTTDTETAQHQQNNTQIVSSSLSPTGGSENVDSTTA